MAGSILAWLPFAATIALSLAGSIRSGVLRFDYLMPAELFPAALLGGGLLLWAAKRAGSHTAATGWSLAAVVGLLVGSQVLAVVTGLASGEAEASGWRLALVAGLLGAYVVALVVMGVSGIALTRAVFGPRRAAGAGVASG